MSPTHVQQSCDLHTYGDPSKIFSDIEGIRFNIQILVWWVMQMITLCPKVVL